MKLEDIVMPFSSPRRLPRVAIAVTVLNAAVCAVLAPTADAQAGRAGTAGAPNTDQPSVYVRDSAIAADKFELGKRMERLKEWHKSADVYQEILEKFQDRVVPTQTNERGQPIKYASVTVAVQERLSRWPEEGLTVYRTRYEPNAATMMEQARADDFPALHQIFSRYFATDTARDAGVRLMDLYLESGEFAAAAWTGDRLLQWHPNLAVHRGAVLFRTALGYHLSGNTNIAKRRFEELRDKHGADLGTVAGKETSLATSLASLLERKPPQASSTAADSYPTVGGGPSRNVIPTGGGIPGSKVWSASIPMAPTAVAGNDANRQQILLQLEAARSSQMGVNVIPVVDRDELFFHDGQRLRALQLETGVPLPGWVQTYGGRQMGQFTLPSAGPNVVAAAPGDPFNSAAFLQQPRQQTLTLTDDAVLAVMGTPDARQMAAAGAGDSGTRLVCLDRTTGKSRWVVAPRELPNSDQLGSKNIAFSGSPLVVGENVYVIGRGSSGAGVEDCHVICYELASGRFRWASYIASAQNYGGNAGAVIFGNETLSHLAFSSGRVFVMTNVGAVAAVDAYSGATEWLSLYPRDEATNSPARAQLARMNPWGGAVGGMSSAPSTDSTKPWEFNPVLIHDGKVFALPTDGRHLLVYDAGTGEEIKRIGASIKFYGSDEPRFDEEAQSRRITMLLGAIGPHLVVAGPESVFILDYEKMKPVKPGDSELTEESIYYHQPLGEMIGRPFLTASQVFAPTKSALYVIDLPRTRTTHRYPKGGGAWPDGEAPGNVVVTGGHVVISDARNVNVYTDIEGIRQKYEAAMRANPNDVEARLVYAELMFNAREFGDARKSLDEAIKVLGGREAMRPGPLRDRVFGDALMFAQKLGAEKTPDSIAIAEELFDHAAASAQNASQQVNYRITRGRFIDSLKEVVDPDYPRAVRLYHEILASPEMRIITISGDDGLSQQAGALAESAINDLKLKVGPHIYTEFEKQAFEKLAALRQAASPEPAALLEIAENYPNADVARDAMMFAAEAFEKGEQPRMATQVLRRAYLKYGAKYPSAQKARLAEGMARNYLKTGNLGAALGRLHKAAALMPDAKLTGPALTLPSAKALTMKNGQAVATLSQAAAALEEIVAGEAMAVSLPEIQLPPPLTVEQILAGRRAPPALAKPQTVVNVQALVQPPHDLSLSHGRSDCAVAWMGGQLALLRPGAAAPAWTSTALSSAATGLLWLDESRLAVWSESELALVDARSGKALWKLEPASLPAVELIGGESAVEVLQNEAQAAAAVQVANPAGIMRQLRIGVIPPGMLINPNVINNLPQAQPAPQQAASADNGVERVLHIRPLADRLILATSTGRVAAVDLKEGKALWQTRITRGASIQQAVASDDFIAIRTLENSSGQLVVLDSHNGQQVYRRAFNTSQRDWVMNMALSSDGTLIWTSQQSMFAKDLYDNEEPLGEPTPRSYVGMNQPNQLVIHNREVFAVSDGGGFIDRRALRGLRPLDHPIGTGYSDPNTRIRVAEGRLYIATGRSLIAFHLEQNTASPAWLETDIVSESGYRPADLMITRKYLVLPGLAGRNAENPSAYMLDFVSRELIANKETGKVAESALRVAHAAVPASAKVRTWQAVNGGLYFLTEDNALHFLKDAGN